MSEVTNSALQVIEVRARIDSCFTKPKSATAAKSPTQLTKTGRCLQHALDIVQAALAGLARANDDVSRPALAVALTVNAADILATNDEAVERLYDMLQLYGPIRFGFGSYQKFFINTLLNIQRLASMRPASNEDALAKGLSQEAVASAIAKQIGVSLSFPTRSMIPFATMFIGAISDGPGVELADVDHPKFYNDKSAEVDPRASELYNACLPRSLAAIPRGNDIMGACKREFEALVYLLSDRIERYSTCHDDGRGYVIQNDIDIVITKMARLLVNSVKHRIFLAHKKKIEKEASGGSKAKGASAPKTVAALVLAEPDPDNYVFWTSSIETAYYLQHLAKHVEHLRKTSAASDEDLIKALGPQANQPLKNIYFPDIMSLTFMFLNNYLITHDYAPEIPLVNIWLAYGSPAVQSKSTAASAYTAGLYPTLLAVVNVFYAFIDATSRKLMPFRSYQDHNEYGDVPKFVINNAPAWAIHDIGTASLNTLLDSFDPYVYEPKATMMQPAEASNESAAFAELHKTFVDKKLSPGMTERAALFGEERHACLAFMKSTLAAVEADAAVQYFFEPSKIHDGKQTCNIWNLDMRSEPDALKKFLVHIVAAFCALSKRVRGPMWSSKTLYREPAAANPASKSATSKTDPNKKEDTTYALSKHNALLKEVVEKNIAGADSDAHLEDWLAIHATYVQNCMPSYAINNSEFAKKLKQRINLEYNPSAPAMPFVPTTNPELAKTFAALLKTKEKLTTEFTPFWPFQSEALMLWYNKIAADTLADVAADTEAILEAANVDADSPAASKLLDPEQNPEFKSYLTRYNYGHSSHLMTVFGEFVNNGFVSTPDAILDKIGREATAQAKKEDATHSSKSSSASGSNTIAARLDAEVAESDGEEEDSDEEEEAPRKKAASVTKPKGKSPKLYTFVEHDEQDEDEDEQEDDD